MTPIDQAKQLLAQHGFTMSIGGCGCCGSPRVKLSYNGEPIIADEYDVADPADNVCFDMFDDIAARDATETPRRHSPP